MFQFTHPGRGATCISSSRALSTSAFQFTHPGRGATLLPIFQSVLQWFQFTHPGRGATPSWLNARWSGRKFQFTHPGRGATRPLEDLVDLISVSIHAPREGCDRPPLSPIHCEGCFNSRTPGGVRPINHIDVATIMQFQFTHPGRGATVRHWFARQLVKVSIHAPREGCDTPSLIIVRQERGFNSRTPGGVRQALRELFDKAD